MHVKQNNAKRAIRVVVKIGVLSGVEEHLLKEAYDAFKQDGVCSEAVLEIIMQKVIVRCNKCSAESELEKNEFICPKCGSFDMNVLDGEEMFLMSLELE
jgi:hydrogenase nickel incorporation protein HypA/HybF